VIESGKETVVDTGREVGRLSLRVPAGVKLSTYNQLVVIYNRLTGKQVGTTSGVEPFWLPPGTYTITLPLPFIGVSRGDVVVESGQETVVDTTQGLGRLSLRVSTGITLGSTYDQSTLVHSQSTGRQLGTANGTGPFWLLPGTYTITLPSPFIGVSHGDVVIESGKETVVDTGREVGRLSLRVPAGVKLSTYNRLVVIYNRLTGRQVGTTSGVEPFWLPSGTYTITLPLPFIGVSRGDVVVESGKETVVDTAQGLGRLSLRVPAGVTLGNILIYDRSTSEQVGTANGTGPFWLPPGTYTITLPSPFIGVSRGDVVIESGKEIVVDTSQGLGRLSLQIPGDSQLLGISILDKRTGSSMATVNGAGPFWLPPGIYTVTLPSPFIGVNLGNIMVESGQETRVELH
jgi:hypothetical protein